MNKNFIDPNTKSLRNIVVGDKKTDKTAKVIIVETADTPEKVADMRAKDIKDRKKVNLYADFAKRSLIKR